MVKNYHTLLYETYYTDVKMHTYNGETNQKSLLIY